MPNDLRGRGERHREEEPLFLRPGELVGKRRSGRGADARARGIGEVRVGGGPAGVERGVETEPDHRPVVEAPRLHQVENADAALVPAADGAPLRCGRDGELLDVREGGALGAHPDARERGPGGLHRIRDGLRVREGLIRGDARGPDDPPGREVPQVLAVLRVRARPRPALPFLLELREGREEPLHREGRGRVRRPFRVGVVILRVPRGLHALDEALEAPPGVEPRDDSRLEAPAVPAIEVARPALADTDVLAAEEVDHRPPLEVAGEHAEEREEGARRGVPGERLRGGGREGDAERSERALEEGRVGLERAGDDRYLLERHAFPRVERERLERRGAELRLRPLNVSDAEPGSGGLRRDERPEARGLVDAADPPDPARTRRARGGRERLHSRSALPESLDEARGVGECRSLELGGEEHRELGCGCGALEELEMDPDQLVRAVVDRLADPLRLQEPRHVLQRLPDEPGSIRPAVLCQAFESGAVALVEGDQEGVVLVLEGGDLREVPGTDPRLAELRQRCPQGIAGARVLREVVALRSRDILHELLDESRKRRGSEDARLGLEREAEGAPRERRVREAMESDDRRRPREEPALEVSAEPRGGDDPGMGSRSPPEGRARTRSTRMSLERRHIRWRR